MLGLEAEQMLDQVLLLLLRETEFEELIVVVHDIPQRHEPSGHRLRLRAAQDMGRRGSRRVYSLRYESFQRRQGTIMNMILLILVILLIFGGLPQLSGGLHGAGYYPSGVGLVLLIVLLVVLFR
jgi:hypothetical protein